MRKLTEAVFYLPQPVQADVVRSFGGYNAGDSVTINRVYEKLLPNIMLGVMDRQQFLPQDAVDVKVVEEVRRLRKEALTPQA